MSGSAFLFLTAYGNLAVIPDEFRAVPVICKPFDSEEMKSAVAEMLGLDGNSWASISRSSLHH